jgi:hypothetical protein
MILQSLKVYGRSVSPPYLCHAPIIVSSDHQPQADAIYYLGDRAFNAGKYHAAFLYAVQAASIRDPGNLWRVENVLMRESQARVSDGRQ